jgi:5-methylcytosine-specific restriction endonuclease McrA
MTVPLFPEDREKELASMIFGTREFRQAYSRYINSYAWKKRCKEVRRRANNRCERCGSLPIRLEVHHLTYERFQNEPLEDLQALCPGCHLEADQEREAKNQERFEAAGREARYDNARDTYMTKKYGENWEMNCGESEYEEFDEWLERKQENEW